MAAKGAQNDAAMRKLEEYIEKYVCLWPFVMRQRDTDVNERIQKEYTTLNGTQTMNTSTGTSSYPNHSSR